MLYGSKGKASREVGKDKNRDRGKKLATGTLIKRSFKSNTKPNKVERRELALPRGRNFWEQHAAMTNGGAREDLGIREWSTEMVKCTKDQRVVKGSVVE